MLKAIVFDYNGTLVDDLDLAVESYYRAGAERGTGFPARRCCQHISQPPSAKRGLYFGMSPTRSGRRSSRAGRPFMRTWRRSAFKLFPQTETVLIALVASLSAGGFVQHV